MGSATPAPDQPLNTPDNGMFRETMVRGWALLALAVTLFLALTACSTVGGQLGQVARVSEKAGPPETPTATAQPTPSAPIVADIEPATHPIPAAAPLPIPAPTGVPIGPQPTPLVEPTPIPVLSATPVPALQQTPAPTPATAVADSQASLSDIGGGALLRISPPSPLVGRQISFSAEGLVP